MNTLFEKNKRELLNVFIYTSIFTILAHGFIYSNAFFSHDSILRIAFSTWKNWESRFEISIGRFFTPVFYFLRGGIASPWLIGILSLLWLTLSNFTLIKILNFERKYTFFACSIFTTCIPLATTNATYQTGADIFLFALLTSILAVYFYDKFKYSFIISILCLIVTLGLYQAFFQVSATLFLFLLLLNTLKNENYTKIIKEGLKILFILLSSIFLYFILYKAALIVSKITPLNSYNSLGNLDFSVLLQNVLNTYVLPFSEFLNPNSYNSKIVAMLNIVVFAYSAKIYISIIVLKKLKNLNIVLSIILIILFPIALNCAYLLSGFSYSIMQFSFSLVYFFAMFFSQQSEKMSTNIQVYDKQNKATRSMRINMSIILLASLAVIVFYNIVYTNQLYLRKNLEYTTTNMIMNRLIDRIEKTPGFILGETPIVFVGLLEETKYSHNRSEFKNVHETGFSNGLTITFQGTLTHYFKTLLGYPNPVIEHDKNSEFAQEQTVKDMQVYPDPLSIRLIDKQLVVKFSQGSD